AEKASKTAFGHVQVGDGINVTDGVISVAEMTATNVSTTSGGSVQAEIDNLKSSVSSGKVSVRNAITGKGGTVADADGDGVPTYAELAAGVNGITTSYKTPRTNFPFIYFGGQPHLADYWFENGLYFVAERKSGDAYKYDIKSFNDSGTQLSLNTFSCPSGTILYLAKRGKNIWLITSTAYIYKLDMNGSVISSWSGVSSEIYNYASNSFEILNENEMVRYFNGKPVVYNRAGTQIFDSGVLMGSTLADSYSRPVRIADDVVICMFVQNGAMWVVCLIKNPNGTWIARYPSGSDPTNSPNVWGFLKDTIKLFVRSENIE
ncbi:hypothetical protein ACFRCQ_28090, partial [Cytobacillus firmus]|uniref:hypothetical protein n=1 Tax=Cytobacillus firmus TaxID=1399 RepID=UPI003686A43F